MSLDEAQAVMMSELPRSDPKHKAARMVCLYHSQELERQVAAMGSPDLDDPPEPEELKTYEATGVPPPQPAIVAEGLPMSLAEAQETMAKGLPDGHPDKVRAQKTLGAEAAKLEARIAAMDNESSDDDDDDDFGLDAPAEPEVKVAAVVSQPADAGFAAQKASAQVSKAAEPEDNTIKVKGNFQKKVDRKYATEDERIAAEASVEDTAARLESVTFDFNFG